MHHAVRDIRRAQAVLSGTTRIVRPVALQNAASIAGLLLTTEAAIVEIKEKKKASGGHDHSRDDVDY